MGWYLAATATLKGVVVVWTTYERCPEKSLWDEKCSLCCHHVASMDVFGPVVLERAGDHMQVLAVQHGIQVQTWIVMFDQGRALTLFIRKQASLLTLGLGFIEFDIPAESAAD